MMIEDILFQYSANRNIHKLRPYLPLNFCEQAAEGLLNSPGTVLIATGFWVAGTCETDGPIGAMVLADVLQELGSIPIFVTDRFCAEVLRTCRDHQVLEFPIASHEQSRHIAQTVLEQHAPSCVISVERCGMSADHNYYNMRGVNISAYTAKLDYLFELFPMSIGIGDGGNEIGMGNLREAIQREALPIRPCTTQVTYPVLATVSNWGAYGIIAYLSRKTGRDYLKFVRVGDLLSQLVSLGVVDGVLKKPESRVDGFSLATIETIIRQLAKECQST